MTPFGWFADPQKAGIGGCQLRWIVLFLTVADCQVCQFSRMTLTWGLMNWRDGRLRWLCTSFPPGLEADGKFLFPKAPCLCWLYRLIPRYTLSLTSIRSFTTWHLATIFPAHLSLRNDVSKIYTRWWKTCCMRCESWIHPHRPRPRWPPRPGGLGDFPATDGYIQA